MNLYNLVTDGLAVAADGIALCSEEESWTYPELDHICGCLAAVYRDLGLRSKDRVALMVPNSPQFIFSYLAAVRAGITVIPVNFMYRAAELYHILKDAAPQAIVSDARFLPLLEPVVASLELSPRILLVGSASGGYRGLGDLLAAQRKTLPPVDAKPDDEAAIIYTNAEDGYSKGAVLTHRGLYTNACLSNSYLQVGVGDFGPAILPFFHCFGATVSFLAPFHTGATVALFKSPKPVDVLAGLRTYRPKVFVAVPTSFGQILAYEGFTGDEFASVEVLIAGGAKMPEEIQVPFEKKIGKYVREGYGITEASPVCAFNPPGPARRLGSIGHVLRTLSGFIGDENDRPVPAGEPGEFLVRGENLMKGYLNQPELSAAVLRNGFLHTGDLGYMDDEKYIFLTGLKRDMFITGGFNIYPKEVARLLVQHPEIESARVFPVPNLLYGSLVGAELAVRPGAGLDEAAVNHFCRRAMAGYKIPRVITFRDA